MGRFFRGLIWLITLGKINLDPNAPPDFSKDEKKLKDDVSDCERELAAVRKDLGEASAKLEELEAKVAKNRVDGKPAERQLLFDILLRRDEKAKLEASETLLSRNLRQAKKHLSMIAIYKHSRPIIVRDEVKKISDRIRVRIDTLDVDEDELGERGSELSDDIAISELDAKLRQIENDILEKRMATEADLILEEDDPVVPAQEVRRPPIELALEQAKSTDQPPTTPIWTAEPTDPEEGKDKRERDPA